MHRTPRAGQPHVRTASFLPPLGRPQLHRNLVQPMLAVEVDGVFGDQHPAPLNLAYLAAVRPDRRADLHDVAEPLTVFDDGARLVCVVDHRDETELTDLVALERGLGLPGP